MPPSLAAALDELASLAASPEHAQYLRDKRALFAQRTGAFGPEDPWFEVRSRAFWDWFVTRGGFAARAHDALSDGARAWCGPLERAHRALFMVVHRSSPLVLRDVLGGAEFEIDQVDPGLRDALAAAESPVDGWLVGSPPPDAWVALLPGALFHPEEARAPIERILAEAKRRKMSVVDTLDALLRMERNLRASSRVKAAFAYRAEAL
jgi:hypothetical protein